MGLIFFGTTLYNFSLVSDVCLILLFFFLLYKMTFKKDLILYPFLVCVPLFIFSLGCLTVANLILLTGIFVKCLTCILFVSQHFEWRRRIVLFSLKMHLFFAFVVTILQVIGFGSVVSEVFGFDIHYLDSGVSSFRITGLYDEPSTFGMFMLCHIFLLLSLNFNNFRKYLSLFPVVSFSAPVMLVSLIATIHLYINSYRHLFIRIFSYLFFGLIIFVCIYLVIVSRESAYKLSPLSLRLAQYLIFFENFPYFQGHGFCSAYGIFDLNLGKSDLRNLGFGNFKDAGQVVFLVDRVGVFASLFFFAFILKGNSFFLSFLFLLFFALNKVEYYHFLVLLVSLNLRRSNNDGYR